MTKRQKAYREYLKTDHWKALRLSALERDGGKCVLCKSVDRLQVHHKIYRGRLDDGILDDMETLCRDCHRNEHGIGPTDYEMKCREIKDLCSHDHRPPITLWHELKAMTFDCEHCWNEFGDLMFHFIMDVVMVEQERGRKNWWMDVDTQAYWRDRACAVRNSINERIKT